MLRCQAVGRLGGVLYSVFNVNLLGGSILCCFVTTHQSVWIITVDEELI